MITQRKGSSKKKFKFETRLKIEELSNVSLPKGVFFCKARLLSGGTFSKETSRENIIANTVTWPKSDFNFSCKLSAPAQTGILETCMCRISVRKETKGGKSYDKIGYVDVNLAEYAGAGSVIQPNILTAYQDDHRHRQDNCILKICISMMLKSGDALFKAQVRNENLIPEDPELHHVAPQIYPSKTRWNSSDVIDELIRGEDFMSGDSSVTMKEREYMRQKSVRLDLTDVLEMDDDSIVLDSPTIECIEFLTSGNSRI